MKLGINNFLDASWKETYLAQITLYLTAACTEGRFGYFVGIFTKPKFQMWWNACSVTQLTLCWHSGSAGANVELNVDLNCWKRVTAKIKIHSQTAWQAKECRRADIITGHFRYLYLVNFWAQYCHQLIWSKMMKATSVNAFLQFLHIFRYIVRYWHESRVSAVDNTSCAATLGGTAWSDRLGSTHHFTCHWLSIWTSREIGS